MRHDRCCASSQFGGEVYRYFRRAKGGPNRYSERGTDELIRYSTTSGQGSNGRLTPTFRKIAQSWVAMNNRLFDGGANSALGCNASSNGGSDERIANFSWGYRPNLTIYPPPREGIGTFPGRKIFFG